MTAQAGRGGEGGGRREAPLSKCDANGQTSPVLRRDDCARTRGQACSLGSSMSYANCSCNRQFLANLPDYSKNTIRAGVLPQWALDRVGM